MAQSPLFGQSRRSEYRDRLASQLLAQGSDSSPVQHPLQGAARLAQALAGGMIGMKQDQRADERQKAYTATMQGAMSAQDPQAMIAALSGNQDTAPQALAMQQQLIAQRQADQARQNDPMYGRANVRGVGLVDMRGGQPQVVIPEQRAPQAQPPGIAEYEFAKSQGFNGSYLDFQTAKANAGKQPEKPQAQARPMTPEERRAFQVPENVPAFMGPDGKPATLSVPRQEAVWQIDPTNPQIQVNVATGERKALPAPPAMNEGQANAALFADRMAAAEPIISQFGGSGTSWGNKIAAGVPIVGNALVSPDYQKLDQARRDFVNAVLRRESGAVIAESEFDNANRQYFPQPGDSQEVIEQKARNRRTALDGIARAAGNAYKPAGAPQAANGGGQSGGDPLGIR